MKITVKSASAAETKKIGKKIGQLLKSGDLLALTGDLGAGKTTLVKGIAAGLGLKDEKQVASPTFTLVHEYQGREKIYHMDWYRLDKMSEPDQELIEECFGRPGVCLVEWADKAKKVLPNEKISVHIEHLSPKARRIEISSKNLKHKIWMSAFK